MAAGFHSFSGDGNLINFIAILRINIPGAHPGAEAAIGVLCGGGILGFGFMNIAVIPSVICVQPERSSCSRYFALMAWAGAAATSARVRVVKSQVLFILPGTYVRPHRHPHTFELLLPLRGRFVVLNFDDRGTVTHRAILGETCTVLEMAAGTWHAVLSLDTGGIIFEVKHGGYQPVAADDYAHWAPAEGEPGTTELMAWYAQAQVGDSTFAV